MTIEHQAIRVANKDSVAVGRHGESRQPHAFGHRWPVDPSPAHAAAGREGGKERAGRLAWIAEGTAPDCQLLTRVPAEEDEPISSHGDELSLVRAELGMIAGCVAKPARPDAAAVARELDREAIELSAAYYRATAEVDGGAKMPCHDHPAVRRAANSSHPIVVLPSEPAITRRRTKYGDVRQASLVSP